MEVSPFDVTKVPEPWKGILDDELRKLRDRPDVLAIGIAGSWAYEDTWPHSDIDLEVILRGNHDFSLTINETGAVGVDVAFFGDNVLASVPYETRPIHDPQGVLTQELRSRDLREALSRTVHEGLESCERLLERADEAASIDRRSALTFLHFCTWNLSEALTIAAGDHRTILRRCSRLERAMRSVGHEDFLSGCEALFGFPDTVLHSKDLLANLQEGYREVWGFFRDKTIGHPYMLQQPDSERWFRNRIEPVHRNDPRDLVWVVYVEFPDVTAMLFRNLTEHQRLPPDMFQVAEAFPAGPRRWVQRYLGCLSLFPAASVDSLLSVGRDLLDRARAFADEKP